MEFKVVSPTDCTFNWVIVQLDCVPSYNELQDYVINVHWRYNVTYQDIVTDIYGLASFTESVGDNFIPFNELTEAIVTQWLESSLDVASLQSTLIKRVEDIVNPPIISPPLPWVTPSEPIIEEEPIEPIVNI